MSKQKLNKYRVEFHTNDRYDGEQDYCEYIEARNMAEAKRKAEQMAERHSCCEYVSLPKVTRVS